jgi:hypothetical protein
MNGEGEDGEDEGGDEDETPEARKKRMWGAKRKRDNEVSRFAVSTSYTDGASACTFLASSLRLY